MNSCNTAVSVLLWSLVAVIMGAGTIVWYMAYMIWKERQ